MHVYVASSWRNEYQPRFINLLRHNLIPHYDFRNPPNGTGFAWREVKENGEPHIRGKEMASEYLKMIQHPRAQEGFREDLDGMLKSDIFVLIMPAGNSAHLELGWACGKGLKTAILLDSPMEPELMYLLADYMTYDSLEMLEWIKKCI